MRIIAAIIAFSFLPAEASADVATGRDVFYSVCAECHSSNFEQENRVENRRVPALGPVVRRLRMRENFLFRIRNGRFDGMSNFPELSDEEIASVFDFIEAELLGLNGSSSSSSSPSNEGGAWTAADCQRHEDRLARREEIRRCHEEESRRRREQDLPWRPSACEAPIRQQERDDYVRYCTSVGARTATRGPIVINPSPPLPQTGRPMGSNERPVGAPQGGPPVTGDIRRLDIDAPEAELLCRVGGTYRMEMIRPTTDGWSPRWPARRGIEVGVSDGVTRRDEHWLVLIRAQLEAPGRHEPRQGWCLWTAPDIYGLGDRTGPGRSIAIDLRVLPDELPLNAISFESDGDIQVTRSEPRVIPRYSAAEAIYYSIGAIEEGRGLVRIRVKRSDHGALADGTVRFEHPENDMLGFRKPAEPRPSDPQ